jgi:hypothetical protein
MTDRTSWRWGWLLPIVTAGLVGCAGPQPLYHWSSYQPMVHERLKGTGKGPESQILELEKGIQQAATKGAAVPPGLHAHLGLLYLEAGRTAQAVAAWEQEKRLFPESRAYMDFLLNNLRKQGG